MDRNEQPPGQPTPAKQPNKIMNEPATPAACTQDRAGHGIGCEGAARDQLAFTRIHAAGDH